MKQTAVEILIDKLTAVGQLKIPKGSNAITLILEQAKAIEKEQIMNAYKADTYFGSSEDVDAEQYYNETFKSKI